MSRLKIVFTRSAERQIATLHVYITARASEARADGYVSRIVSFCRSLEIFPLRGTKRDELLAGLCTIGFERRITIAFFVASDTVVIEGVFYGGQDLEQALRGRD